MAENLQPESMSTWMRSVEQRLSALERPKAVGNAALQIPQVADPAQVILVNGATFQTCWEIAIPVVIGDAVSIQFDIDLQGTAPTAEVRLTDIASNTDVVALSGSAGYTVRFDWAVPNMEVYSGVDAYRIYVMARYITGGIGMSVYRPARVIHGTSVDFDAEADGNGRIV